MRAESAAPLTFGQLSLWRDVDHMPAQRRHEPNLLRTAPVDAGVSMADLLDAFRGLRTHHEALRTTFDFSDAARPEQIVGPPGARDVPVRCVRVDSTVDPVAAAREVGQDMAQRPFDLTTEDSWRVAILIAGGRPVQLAVVLHHIAVDIWALNLLDQDFHALLSGGPPACCDSPVKLAIAQRSARWQARNESAQQHQRKSFTAVARADGPEIVESAEAVVKATLRSQVALADATARAAALHISVPSLVLAAYCFAAHRTTGADTILVNAMCANRIYPGSSRLLSVMNQWGRYASHAGLAEPFDRFAQRTHWSSVRAHRHGCYDPYIAGRTRDEVAAELGPISPEFSFNYVRAEPAGVPAALSERASAPFSVQHEVPSRIVGPSFYLVVTQGTELSLTGRVMWQGFDAAALETFLVTVHAVLTSH